MTEQSTPVIFHCRHCRAEIGTTDGLRLVLLVTIGDQRLQLEFRDRTRPYCGACGHMTVWYPKQPPKRIVVKISASTATPAAA